jgi:nitrogen fixation protein NifU and related proteins
MSNTDLQELYQQVIIDHGTKPRNKGELKAHTHFANGANPLCGDEILLFLKVEEGIIQDIKFTGEGCAISTASASMMSEFLLGKTISEVENLKNEFVDMIINSPDDEHSSLGKLVILAGVNKYPVRAKCATLAWHTLSAALNKNDTIVTTE